MDHDEQSAGQRVYPGEVDPGQANGERDRSFAQFLTVLEDGHLNTRCSKLLRELNAALTDHVLDNGKGTKAKGKLSLTLDFTLKDGLFTVFADVKTSLPKAPHEPTHLWATPGNNFSTDNPKQAKLPFITAATGASQVRAV